MTEYDNTNRGSIWKDDKKEKDTQRDFKGSADIDGVKYWVSAWKRKEGANPKAPALTFKFERQDGQPQQPRVETGPVRTDTRITSGRMPRDDMDDQIPFAPEFR